MTANVSPAGVVLDKYADLSSPEQRAADIKYQQDKLKEAELKEQERLDKETAFDKVLQWMRGKKKVKQKAQTESAKNKVIANKQQRDR